MSQITHSIENCHLALISQLLQQRVQSDKRTRSTNSRTAKIKVQCVQ
jgi:hypothetical protein